MLCTLDQRLSSLVMGTWGANTFLMHKQLPNPYFQNSQTFILVFLAFSSNKCWWRLPLIFLFGRCTFWLFACTPVKGQVAANGNSTGEWQRVKLFNQCAKFYRDFFFIFPFLFYLLFCPYLCINFAMLLCLVCVCLSIAFVVRSIFVLCTHGTYTFAHTLRCQALYPGLCCESCMF